MSSQLSRTPRFAANTCRPRLEPLEDRSLLSPVIPVFHSNPDADKTLYLDFDGHFQEEYGDYEDVRTPAMDFDGRPDVLSTSERRLIREVWARVAEDFAPFNIDVTTESPASIRDGHEVRIAIGGDWDDWYHDAVSGYSLIGSFMIDTPNVAYVFSDYIGANASQIATTVSHEAGHAIGLRHQSDYDDAGMKVREYAIGEEDWTPIMGSNLSTDRTIWWYGPSSVGSIQDDMLYLGTFLGSRADDHGITVDTATDLGTLTRGDAGGPVGELTGTGIIERTVDLDYFTFHVARDGAFRARLYVADLGANLDARLYLARINPGGFLTSIASAAPETDLGARIDRWLERGDYVLIAGSQGEYGDVGQYRLHLRLAPNTAAPRVSQVRHPYGGDPHTIGVWFSEAIAAGTFTSADVRVIAPDGRGLPVKVIASTRPGFFTLYVRELDLTRPGLYRLEIGPNIRDRDGHFLNQDGDNVFGEPKDDVFVTYFGLQERPKSRDR